MAKISPVSIKYMIYAKFEADGLLEKPDVIGAIFGQTEGLLGEELELRELQKEGKIGRIEVNLKHEDTKTTGIIEIPSALDKADTTLIAAAIETIERIGPSNAKIITEKIEDVRENKREYILNRAKELLKQISIETPNTKEIKEKIIEKDRISKIIEYGEEKLPAGNLENNEIIVVEGRADVVNLIKEGIENVIGMNGTKLPETIKKLGVEKDLILFVDGDRGGKLIAKNAVRNANIKYVVFAPDGKEVEELTQKEILQCLRKKISAEEFLRKEDFEEKKKEEKKIIKDFNAKEVIEKNLEKFKKILEEAEKTKKIILSDLEGNIIKKVTPRNLYKILTKLREEVFLVVDKATPTIIKIAEKRKIKAIIANNFMTTSESVELISL